MTIKICGPYVEVVKIPIVCAACKKVIGYKLWPKEQANVVTHSICKPCAEKLYPNEAKDIL